MNYRQELLRIITESGALQRFDPPIQLASGAYSHAFIDGKLAVAKPNALQTAGAAMVAAAREARAEFDSVGGLVLGAVPFTFAVAYEAQCSWFLIRKEPKGRGTNLWVEGGRIETGTRVMLVDDVVTTGGSIKSAYDKVVESGAEVTFAATLVDRGDRATAFFDAKGVPYRALLTYRDLGITSADEESGATAATR